MRKQVSAMPVVFAAVVVAAWMSCGVNPSLATEAYPELPGRTLKLGREIWLGTCAVCHTDDFTGAPQVTDAKAWEPRLAKGKETLYEHALNGFFGPQGTQMPARGDNPELSDSEVKAAVDYMLALIVALGPPTQ